MHILNLDKIPSMGDYFPVFHGALPRGTTQVIAQ